MRETAITDSTNTKISARIRATPLSFVLFIAPRFCWLLQQGRYACRHRLDAVRHTTAGQLPSLEHVAGRNVQQRLGFGLKLVRLGVWVLRLDGQSDGHVDDVPV